MTKEHDKPADAYSPLRGHGQEAREEVLWSVAETDSFRGCCYSHRHFSFCKGLHQDLYWQ